MRCKKKSVLIGFAALCATLAVWTAGEDRDGVAMAYHLPLRLAPVGQLDVEKINADNLPRVLALRRKRLFC